MIVNYYHKTFIVRATDLLEVLEAISSNLMRKLIVVLPSKSHVRGFDSSHRHIADTRGQSYKTFYGRNLQIFVIS